MKLQALMRQAAERAVAEPRLYLPLAASTAASYVVAGTSTVLRQPVMRIFATHSVLGGEYPATRLSVGLILTGMVFTWLPMLVNVLALIFALGVVSRNWRLAAGEPFDWGWPDKLGRVFLQVSGICAVFLFAVFGAITLLISRAFDPRATSGIAFAVLSYPLAIGVAPLLRNYVLLNQQPPVVPERKPPLSTVFWITGHAFFLSVVLEYVCLPLLRLSYREAFISFFVGLVLTLLCAIPLQLGIFGLCSACAYDPTPQL